MTSQKTLLGSILAAALAGVGVGYGLSDSHTAQARQDIRGVTFDLLDDEVDSVAGPIMLAALPRLASTYPGTASLHQDDLDTVSIRWLERADGTRVARIHVEAKVVLPFEAPPAPTPAPKAKRK